MTNHKNHVPMHKKDRWYWTRMINRQDGFPLEPGVHSIVLRNSAVNTLERRYESFQKAMRRRKNFRIIEQQVVHTEFDGTKMYIMYQHDGFDEAFDLKMPD